MTGQTQKNQTIWLDEDYPDGVRIIDQRVLPFTYSEITIDSVESMAESILTMAVRGAGCIGVSAGFGMYLAALEARSLTPAKAEEHLNASADKLLATRPTATNLSWAVAMQLKALSGIEDENQRIQKAREIAVGISDDDVSSCRRIGEIGVKLIRDLHTEYGRKINILTHCNAGWLAFVKHGSATAPIYAAQKAGIPIHVVVGESRPRNQGALTAWELNGAGVEHTYLVDSAVGHIIQNGEVDIVFVGADRVSMNGDVANKIGTYLRALAAREGDVPFYVNFPSSTLDPYSKNGISDIEIEERPEKEVSHVSSVVEGRNVAARVLPPGSPARNPAFDVTPHQMITGLITERGLCDANPMALAKMFPDYVARAS
ncbi:MAG: S-methyl-5-thioribose-1-phosphate isomerase [Alphaproteobacteria bacterium]|nr:S-methyl-5-thioribose-1-phosphate isomerase [Alphaproteobacteria bacterium]